MLALALIAAIIWAVLLTARGGFWTFRDHDGAWAGQLPADIAWPAVAIIVPARDEAQVIEKSIGALLRQDYPGPFHVLLIDDDSKDDTGALATALAERLGPQTRLTVLRNETLSQGWTGKLWAMANGLRSINAEVAPTPYVLFCDADIALAPDTLRNLVAKAVTEGRALVSLMAKLNATSVAERLLVPAFIYFFAKLYPFAWVSNPRRKVAAAAGGCMLVDRARLVEAGGLERIRGDIIDDCALGRLMKTQGPIVLALTERAVSLRVYDGIGPIRRMVTRSAYAELKYAPERLALAIIGLGLTYVVPPLAMIFGEGYAGLIGFLTTAAMMLSFVPVLRFYRLSPLLATTLPLIAIVYGAFTIESALLHRRGRGGEWKGRYQALPHADHLS